MLVLHEGFMLEPKYNQYVLIVVLHLRESMEVYNRLYVRQNKVDERVFLQKMMCAIIVAE